jgi:hypothetical protein
MLEYMEQQGEIVLAIYVCISLTVALVLTAIAFYKARQEFKKDGNYDMVMLYSMGIMYGGLVTIKYLVEVGSFFIIGYIIYRLITWGGTDAKDV